MADSVFQTHNHRKSGIFSFSGDKRRDETPEKREGWTDGTGMD
jgi:hypothetical protein